MLTLCLSFAVVVLDQATKHLIRSFLPRVGAVSVIPGLFDLRYVRNTGAAWGIFEGFNQWLVVLSVAMLVFILGFRRHFLPDALVPRIAAGLMIGGIAGNLVDRVRLSYVVDFLDFYWRTHHFPTFNVADSAICTGVGLYLLFQLRGNSPKPDGATRP